MGKKKISVIIPTLNEESSLEDLLADLVAYNAEANIELELIVVDARSTDLTREIASKYCDQVLETNPGRGNQLNQGAKAATGDILWFLHADTLVNVACIPKFQEEISKGIKAGCFHLRFLDEHLGFRMIAWGSNLRAKYFKSFYGDQGIFVERKLFLELGGFKEIPIMEDLEFSRRLRKATPVSVVNAFLGTSPRRFRKGIVRTLILMQMLKLGYFLRISPKYLAKIYGMGRG